MFSLIEHKDLSITLIHLFNVMLIYLVFRVKCEEVGKDETKKWTTTNNGYDNRH